MQFGIGGVGVALSYEAKTRDAVSGAAAAGPDAALAHSRPRSAGAAFA